MAPHSSTLAWKIPWTEEAGGTEEAVYRVTKESDTTGQLGTLYKLLYPIFGEGDGTPLQYSCLENPMDGGAW